MSSNRLYDIFRKRAPLRRKDIEAYGSSTDPIVKNDIEQRSMESAFEADAMEGWESLSYDTKAMTSLDQKFSVPATSVRWFSIGGIFTGTIAAGLLIYMWIDHGQPQSATIAEAEQHEPITQLLKDQEITLEASDVVIPEVIENMNQAPAQEQIQPENIINDFKAIEEKHQETEARYHVDSLPYLPLPVIGQQQPLTRRIYAKEIYLHDLKLVDYRTYRSKPEVKTRQVVLTGTPANMETAPSEDTEATWKDVDVPYIEYMDKSMRVFGKKNYKKALARFETVIKTYPDDVNASFYAGLCLFNLREYNSAMDHFDSCISGPYSNFDEEAVWMKALCYEHLGETSKAKKIFSIIAGKNGYYTTQAVDKLK